MNDMKSLGLSHESYSLELWKIENRGWGGGNQLILVNLETWKMVVKTAYVYMCVNLLN